MDLVHRETDRSTASPEFVAVDIRGEVGLPETDGEFNLESFPGKSHERESSGDMISSSTGVAELHEKQAASVHVDGGPKEQFHPATPTAKRRRAGRRVPAWRDPRKILFAFAALSSVGTLILLYFTLSMGKMTGGQADGQ